MKLQACNKTVYSMDPQLVLDGKVFHKICAKCEDCHCQITLNNFAKNDNPEKTTLLCKTHYTIRFQEVRLFKSYKKSSLNIVGKLL